MVTHKHNASHGHTPRAEGSHLLWYPWSDWGLDALLKGTSVVSLQY